MRNTLLVILLGIALMLSACSSDNNDETTNVAGTWRAPIAITSCTPADICLSAGLVAGTTVNATMILTQDRSDLDGTYTYDLAPISATISGRVGDTAVTLSGLASVALGSITVNLAGNVSGNMMTMAVTHQITLSDGRSANVIGSGTFSR